MGAVALARARRPGDDGFTLIEAIVAMLIMTVGLLGLAQAFIVGLQHMATSSSNAAVATPAVTAASSVP